jgi:hypothetical protein
MESRAIDITVIDESYCNITFEDDWGDLWIKMKGKKYTLKISSNKIEILHEDDILFKSDDKVYFYYGPTDEQIRFSVDGYPLIAWVRLNSRKFEIRSNEKFALIHKL